MEQVLYGPPTCTCPNNVQVYVHVVVFQCDSYMVLNNGMENKNTAYAAKFILDTKEFNGCISVKLDITRGVIKLRHIVWHGFLDDG